MAENFLSTLNKGRIKWFIETGQVFPIEIQCHLHKSIFSVQVKVRKTEPSSSKCDLREVRHLSAFP